MCLPVSRKLHGVKTTFILFSLVEQISIMFSETRETEIILAPVVQAGLDALKVYIDVCCGGVNTIVNFLMILYITTFVSS
jgi:hypothetical protein